MFVLNKTYKKALEEKWKLELEYAILLKQWNELIDRINAKGGEVFLQGSQSEQFTKQEVNQLIFLLHPDKHDGSKVAGELTAKLLTMRKK